jgi:DNA polymerase elongation subunit (family B)
MIALIHKQAHVVRSSDVPSVVLCHNGNQINWTELASTAHKLGIVDNELLERSDCESRSNMFGGC